MARDSAVTPKCGGGGVAAGGFGAKPKLVGNGAAGDSQAPESGTTRLGGEPVDVAWSVDCAAEATFLYSAAHEDSELGIFVVTREPLDVGTRVTLRFEPGGSEASYCASGVVQWINAMRALSENRNPGMGVLFLGLEPQDRRRLKATIRTFAYVRNFVN